MRLCPDCGSRELDKGFQFCADCAEARRYIQHVIADANYRAAHPEKYGYRPEQKEYQKIYMRAYRQTEKGRAAHCEYMREWSKQEKVKQYKLLWQKNRRSQNAEHRNDTGREHLDAQG